MLNTHTSRMCRKHRSDIESAANPGSAFRGVVKKVFTLAVVCCIYLVVLQPAFSQSVPTFRVVGRVVDENGNGLAGVGISISPAEYQELWTNPYSGEETDENGRFSIEGAGNTEALWKSRWFLYTRMRAPKRGLSLIDPPFFRSLQIVDNQFGGIPFLPEGKTQVDVGDVSVKFHYGNLVLKAPADTSHPVPWEEVMISVRHPNGGEVAASTLSKNDRNAFVKPTGELIMSLPTGKWKIEIMNLGHDKVLFTSEYVDVSPDRTSTAYMIARKAQDEVLRSQSSCSTPADAVRGEDGEIKVFTSEELMERVRKTAPVKRPPNLKQNNIFGTVTADVIVDKNGRLSCIRPTTGHPFAQFAVTQSLRNWTFHAYRSPTGKRSMAGTLSVPFDFR